MRLRYVILTAMLSVATLVGCSGPSTAEEGTQSSGKAQTESKAEAEISGQKHHMNIHVKDYGTITVELDPQYAPLTVDHFIKLAKDGFYDGLTFHRIIDGFMIQGGDPMGTGMGGADETIKGEFTSNGVDNPISHKRGVISMARSADKNSASSQFFIVQSDSPHLDGDYAAFGQVTEGMEIVDKICQEVKVQDGNGTVAPENQPVIERIEVLEETNSSYR